MARFVNTAADLPASLAQHFVPFSFEYPRSWVLTGADGSNFVKVEQKTGDGQTVENFAVGWFEHPPDPTVTRTLYPTLVGQLSGQFAAQFPNYEKVSEGEAMVAGVAGYEMRFRGWAPDDGSDRVDFWGRAVLLPGPTGKGVALVMIATSNSSSVRGPDDVGVKGTLPAILSTFRLN